MEEAKSTEPKKPHNLLEELGCCFLTEENRSCCPKESTCDFVKRTYFDIDLVDEGENYQRAVCSCYPQACELNRGLYDRASIKKD
jgi:hypothetical protein